MLYARVSRRFSPHSSVQALPRRASAAFASLEPEVAVFWLNGPQDERQGRKMPAYPEKVRLCVGMPRPSLEFSQQTETKSVSTSIPQEPTFGFLLEKTQSRV